MEEEIIKQIEQDNKILRWHFDMLLNGYKLLGLAGENCHAYIHENGFEYREDNWSHKKAIKAHMAAGTTPPPF